MKFIPIIFFIVLGLLYALLRDVLFDVLSDISSIMFFSFATLAMISLGALIAIDTAKALNYKILNNELENLKDELHEHITRNMFSIEVSNEAKNLHKRYKELEQIIDDKKGENYES